MNLSKEVTNQVNAHLDEVRKYLGKLPADERKEILQDIESHIYDAVESRGNGEPTFELVEAVIAEMDPPDSYGELPDTPKSTPRKWWILASGLILILLTVALIKQHPATPPNVIGQWETVDFVSDIQQFHPHKRSFPGDLYLKELTFLPDGKTDRLYWTWKDGILHHSGDNTDARFVIKKISGETYLFLEWMSGDVTLREQSPKYYVLKKSSKPEKGTL